MKILPEFQNFGAAASNILSVSNKELQSTEGEYPKRQANRRSKKGR
jgi:hypothetical protein